MNISSVEVSSGEVIQECGTQENKLREVLKNYKQICILNLDKFGSGYHDKKELLKTVRNLFDHLFEQNSLLVSSLEKRDDELFKLVSEKANWDEKVKNNVVNNNDSIELENANKQIEILQNELCKKNEELSECVLKSNSSLNHFKPSETPCNCDLTSYKNQIASLEKDLKIKCSDLAACCDKMKKIESALKDENWALAAEVNEKHGEASKLRQNVSELEEKLRQAHLQTSLKDDIIKQMRSSRSKGPKLCDLVTEITLQQKRRENKMTVDGEINDGSTKECAEPGPPGALPGGTDKSHLITSELRSLTPREQVASLREALLADIQKFESPKVSDDFENIEQVKPKQFVDLGGGDGVDVGVLTDTSSSSLTLYSARDDSAENSAFNETRSQIDNLVLSAKTSEDFNMLEHQLAIKTGLIKLEAFLKDDSPVLTTNSRDDLLAHLMKKEETIESLQREIKNLKEGFGSLDVNMDHYIHFVDNVLKKLPLNNCLPPETTEPTNESLEQKLLLLESTLGNICDELAAERKLVTNKEEILQNLHGTVQLRENQVKSFTSKVQELERQLEEQRNVIAELQQALQNCKKGELKEKDQEIRSLRFGFCELEEKQLFYEKKCKKLKFALEQAQSENSHFMEKLSFLERVVPRIKDLQEISILYKEKNLELERCFREREAEVKKLQKLVNRLEEEIEMEVEQNEKRIAKGGTFIAAILDKNNVLQNQMRKLDSEYQFQKNQATDQQCKIENLESNLIESERNLKLMEKDSKQIRETVTILTKNLKDGVLNEKELSTKLEQCQTELLNTNKTLEKAKFDSDELAKNNERAQNNLRKMLTSVDEEKEKLKTERDYLQEELAEIKQENIICSERISRLINKEERTRLEFAKEISTLRDKNRNSDLALTNTVSKLQDYEAEIAKLSEINNILRVEAADANESCQRMRLHSHHLTKIFEQQGKMADDFRCRQDGWREPVQDYSQEIHHNKIHSRNANGCDPWMPMPPAARSLWKPHRTQLHDSSECFVESGFQSMMPSPVPTISPTCSHNHDSVPLQRTVR